jgi:hypothetical protein
MTLVELKSHVAEERERREDPDEHEPAVKRRV